MHEEDFSKGKEGVDGENSVGMEGPPGRLGKVRLRGPLSQALYSEAG